MPVTQSPIVTGPVPVALLLLRSAPRIETIQYSSSAANAYEIASANTCPIALLPMAVQYLA